MAYVNSVVLRTRVHRVFRPSNIRQAEDRTYMLGIVRFEDIHEFSIRLWIAVSEKLKNVPFLALCRWSSKTDHEAIVNRWTATKQLQETERYECCDEDYKSHNR